MENEYDKYGGFEDFLFEAGILKFGDFTLKSGRKSPFFLNLGDVDDGEKLLRIGSDYAMTIYELMTASENPIPKPDILFGPAYKGIPLATATATCLLSKYDINVRVSSTRKEAKTHGEGTGSAVTFFMSKPKNGDHAWIIEDVFTTGDTKEEAVADMRSVAPEVNIDGIIIAVDRCEAMQGSNKSAIQTFYEKNRIMTYARTNIHKIVDKLHNKKINGKIALTDENKAAIERYLAEYGPKGE